jgi:hypothetical protein
VWEHDLAEGLRILRLAIDTHLITRHFAPADPRARRAGEVLPVALPVLIAAAASHEGSDHAYLADFGRTRRLAEQKTPDGQGQLLGTAGDRQSCPVT